MKKIMPILVKILIGLLLCFIGACTTVPITNRQSLQLVSNSEIMAMSLKQYNQVLKQEKLSDNQGSVDMVRRVGLRIASAAEAFLRENGFGNEIASYKWEFNVIDDDKTANAWAMPGGKVAVYSGILKYTQNDAGLAVVMGHEVAHVLANHSNERMSQALLTSIGSSALSIALSNSSENVASMAVLAFGVGANVGILLPYSRLHESEADRIGMILMAKAGYDPTEALHFWQRMRSSNKSELPAFLSTHPDDDKRINDIQKHIPEAMRHYNRKTN